MKSSRLDKLKFSLSQDYSSNLSNFFLLDLAASSPDSSLTSIIKESIRRLIKISSCTSGKNNNSPPPTYTHSTKHTRTHPSNKNSYSNSKPKEYTILIITIKETTSMGRQNMDQGVAGSSIVLLQERFKQLQRLKEMREERQVRKILPQSTYNYDEHQKLTTFQDPLALGLNSNSHRMAHFGAIRPEKFASPVSARGPHGFFEKNDVDTSLRL